MGYESCCQRYSHYFSPTLKEIFGEAELSIPYILEFIDEQCNDTECSHHIFHIIKEFRSIGGSEDQQRTGKDLPWVLQCHGCACLLGLVELDNSTLSYPAMGAALGLDHRSLDRAGKSGIERIQDACNIEPGGETGINERPSGDVG